MSIEEIGCCGAYCGTCQVRLQNFCKGCKIGYSNEKRDLSKAKCKIKICCITKSHNSCSDCQNYNDCSVLKDFYAKNGQKYKKYQQATVFIKDNGYEKFLAVVAQWKNAHGKYPK